MVNESQFGFRLDHSSQPTSARRIRLRIQIYKVKVNTKYYALSSPNNMTETIPHHDSDNIPVFPLYDTNLEHDLNIYDYKLDFNDVTWNYVD